MNYRHEFKHELNYADFIAVRSRLRATFEHDKHTLDGTYLIRSLYFDNLYDKALREKIDGVNIREKFRIRYYNLDKSFIALEKKSKINSLSSKDFARLTLDEAEKIASGKIGYYSGDDRPLLDELYRKMQTEGLRPKVIVDYTREPFIYYPGNVRVTLDYNIRTGMKCTDFLAENAVTIPVPDNPIILEVKWDDYLPAIVRDIVQTPSTHEAAFSKYAACRMYD